MVKYAASTLFYPAGYWKPLLHIALQSKKSPWGGAQEFANDTKDHPLYLNWQAEGAALLMHRVPYCLNGQNSHIQHGNLA